MTSTITHAQDRWGNVFYEGETVVQKFTNDQTAIASHSFNPTLVAVTGLWYLRDYSGALVASGSLSAATSLSLGALPCGWYKLFVTQVGGATFAGSATISVVPLDDRFKDVRDFGTPYPYGEADEMFGYSPWARWFGACMGRYSLPYTDETTDRFNDMMARIELDADPNRRIFPLEEDLYLSPSFADSVRPRPVMVNYVQGNDSTYFACSTAEAPSTPVTHCVNGVTTLVQLLAANHPTQTIYHEGPRNEPDGTGALIFAAQTLFYNTVKAADADALVCGPQQVSISAGYLATFDAFLTLCAAAGTPPLDAISFHPYNNVNADLAEMRASLDGFFAVIDNHGFSDLPVFSTEQGFNTIDFGATWYHKGAEWDLMMLLMYEQYGIPKEHCYLFYDQASGFTAQPQYWMTTDRNLLPPGPMLHVYAQEIFGKTFAEALDFGDVGNDMQIGNRYHDAGTGDDVIVLMGCGLKDAVQTFEVTGASNYTQVDCFGGQSILSLNADNELEVTVPLQPVYIRVPAGSQLTLKDKWGVGKIGRPLAPETTITTSGSHANQVANADRMINDTQENSYFNLRGAETAGRDAADNPYIDDTHPDTNSPWDNAQLPSTGESWAQFKFHYATRFDRVIVQCAPVHQSLGTIYDFDIQTWDGAAWVTQATVTEPFEYGALGDPDARVMTFADQHYQENSPMHSFVELRWQFDIELPAAVTTTKLRMLVRTASYGLAPTIEAHNALFGDLGAFGNNFMIRELRIYNSELAIPRVVRAAEAVHF